MTETPETPEIALKDAIKAAGGPAALARALGIKQPSVFEWKIVPIGRVLAVEKASGVRRERLRPDFYPPPPSEAAE